MLIQSLDMIIDVQVLVFVTLLINNITEKVFSPFEILNLKSVGPFINIFMDYQ